MNIINIDVPSYVNYISDWVDLQIPQGHCIIDKTITGCGFTEYFLHNTQNVILCSPRKILLENKSEQNPHVHYVKNELEKTLSVDMDLDFKGTASREDLQEVTKVIEEEEVTKQDEFERKKYVTNLKEKIIQYLDQCTYENRSFKILVTYDSLKHVLEVLNLRFTQNSMKEIQFVVDEFQSIFTDSKFKGNVELNFVEHLQDCQNVCYLSATPMIEKYLDRIPEFAGLPYYKFIWDSSKVVKAKIIRKRVTSIFEEAGKIITQYRNGQFPRKILEDKSIHESKEVVFYVNSVKTICGIIRRFNLKPEETNIICSKDNKNRKKLRAVKHDFGSVSLSPDQNKMFTFCTRTVYLGADFYSKSAYTVVFSDCNIETLCVDVSLDLPQILGRQRLKENVFRNECLLFYKIQKKPITWEMFQDHIAKKRDQTNHMLSVFSKTSSCLEERSAVLNMVKVGLFFKYKIDYLGIQEKTDTPAFNNLVELSEERAWEVAQIDYQDDITVKRILSSDYIIEEFKDHTEIDNNTLECSFMFDFNELKWWDEKMKLYCDFLDSYYDLFKTTDIGGVPREFQNYVNLLGTKRIKALKYRQNECENEYNIIISQNQFKSHIINTFQVDQVFPLGEIKSKLQGIYDSLGVKKTAKATDLIEYFEIEQTFTNLNDGRRSRALKLVKVKY